MRRLLSLADLPGDALDALLDRAAAMKTESPDPSLLLGRQIALLFLNPSLRTRTSMELAAKSLGAEVVSLTPGQDAWKLETEPGAVMDGDKAEHVIDAVRALGEMAHLVGVRTFSGMTSFDEDRTEPVLSTIAAAARVPIVNMESALDHPLQALADLLTLRETCGNDLRGVPVTLTWAPHPRPLPMAVGAAFLRGAARMGMDVRVAAPEGFTPPDFLIEEARGLLPGAGDVTVTDDQAAAVRGSRAVYAKAWAAPALLGDADAGAAARTANSGWRIDKDLMALGDDAVFLHCLPVRRNVVVTDGVLDGPRCRVYAEAGNRLHTARAALAEILGGPGS